MSLTRTILGALGTALVLAGPVAAQDRALHLFVSGGGYNALTNLNDAGSADFKKVGYTVGGGVGAQLQRYVTLRGDFNFAKNQLRVNQQATGQDVNRFFYDASLQLGYPTSSGLEPYLFAGGGAATPPQIPVKSG